MLTYGLLRTREPSEQSFLISESLLKNDHAWKVLVYFKESRENDKFYVRYPRYRWQAEPILESLGYLIDCNSPKKVKWYNQSLTFPPLLTLSRKALSGILMIAISTAYELYTNEHDAYDNIRITHAYEHKIITRKLCRHLTDHEIMVALMPLCYGIWSGARPYASLPLYQAKIRSPLCLLNP